MVCLKLYIETTQIFTRNRIRKSLAAADQIKIINAEPGCKI